MRIIANRDETVPVGKVFRSAHRLLDCRESGDVATAVGGDYADLSIADRFGYIENIFGMSRTAEYQKLAVRSICAGRLYYFFLRFEIKRIWRQRLFFGRHYSDYALGDMGNLTEAKFASGF